MKEGEALAEKNPGGGDSVCDTGVVGCTDRTASVRKAGDIELYVLRREADTLTVTIGS